MKRGIDRDLIAQRVAAAIPRGSYVNLGIGAPTKVANHLGDDSDVILHTENGLLGMGGAPAPDRVDPDLINAGKQPVTAVTGAAYFHHADSFGMMRGGHLDVCVLGAYQVSQAGDLANWSTGAPGAIPAVGGAMDLAMGAKDVYVMTDLFTREGEPKIVAECTYPITGLACVSRIFTDFAEFAITPDGLAVNEIYTDVDIARLSEQLGLTLIDATASPASSETLKEHA